MIVCESNLRLGNVVMLRRVLRGEIGWRWCGGGGLSEFLC